ncbi:MAG: homoserine dehydrogenase [Nitrospirae bacterium]|jgi:homoserine dehydrogenase|nr:homoserine dehydrogenase [Nitrospirota bacterium]
MKKEKVNVGIIGFGVVGSGTAKVLLNNKNILKERLGFELNLKKIADRDIKTDRGIKIPEGVLTTDVNEIFNDPEIDIVVELIGGIRPAKDFILKAIQNGKHIVTANKALLATEGTDIFNSALEKGVEVGFEASVAGAIPIIKVMKEGLIANRIKAIYGIINGTSNYILTKMTYENMEFSDALKEAQKLGYAEADPTFDIEGIDTAHKITILATLSYGIPLSYSSVHIEGITKITAQDIAFAGELGYKVKLLAITKETDGEIELRVHPTMLPKDYLIAKVDGPFNAIYVDGDATGSTMYYGRGAGSIPTGSAVVSDIADIARNIQKDAIGRVPTIPRISGEAKIKKMDNISSKYYFRFSALDRPGVLSKISGILGNFDISIASVIQKGRRIGEEVPLVVLTHRAREKDVRQALEEIDKLHVVTGKTVFIRVEGEEEI